MLHTLQCATLCDYINGVCVANVWHLLQLLHDQTRSRALAAVAVSSAAMAQATISGTFNVDVQNTMDASDMTVGMGDAIVRVDVAEDLGGGIKATANTTINTKAGRGGAVTGNGYGFAISGGFGALSVSNYLNGGAELSAGISADTDMNEAVAAYTHRTRVNYALPAMVPGLTLQVRWDETSDDTDSPAGAVTPEFDSTTKFSAAYKTGPFNVGYSGRLNAIDEGTVSLGYDAGFAKFDYARTNAGHYEIAVVAPLSAALSAGLHLQAGDATEAMGFRVTYALSKRTSVSYNYVDIKATANTDTAAVGDNYRVRVSHSF
jgi:hypothetical protein